MPNNYFKSKSDKINTQNFLEKLFIGTISERQLVEMFGTKRQLDKYIENNKFVSSNKKTILNNANRFCKIEDKKNKQYEIKEIYSYVKPKEIEKMKESLYQYIIPLLLINLFKSNDKKIKLTLRQYSRLIEMVNQNYNYLKTQIRYAYTEKEQKEILKATSIDCIEVMNDFYSRTDDMIDEYIERALEYLDKTGFIKVDNIHMVCEEIIENSDIIDGNGKIKTNIIINKRQSTEEERDFEVKCMNIADTKANIDIQNKSERYFGKKSTLWKDVLNEQLREKNIKFFYYTYEIRIINLDSVKCLYSEYPEKNENELIKEFTNQIIKNIMDNADRRFDNKRYTFMDSKDNFLLNFSNMCDITISPITEEDKKLKNRLKYIDNDKKYNQSINVKYKGE